MLEIHCISGDESKYCPFVFRTGEIGFEHETKRYSVLRLSLKHQSERMRFLMLSRNKCIPSCAVLQTHTRQPNGFHY